MIKLEINKLSDNTIEVISDGRRKTEAAVFFAKNGANEVEIYSLIRKGLIWKAPFEDIEVDGVTYSTAEDTIVALNQFIGAFSRSGGSVITPGDTIISVENTVVDNEITIIVKTDRNPDGYQTSYVYDIGDTITEVTSSVSGSDIILSIKTDKQPLGHNITLEKVLNDLLSATLNSTTKILTLTMSTGTVKVVDMTPIIPKSGFAIRWNVTGLNVNINNGSTYNLLQHLIGLTPALQVDTTQAEFPLSSTGQNTVIKFPAIEKMTSYSFDLRLTGTMASSSDRTFIVQLRRPTNVLIKGDTFTKSSGTSLTNESGSIFTYTNGILDPFTIDGFKLELNNSSSSSITLTGFELIIDGTIKNY